MADNSKWIESEPFKAPWVRIRGRVSRAGEVTWSPAIRTFKGPQGQDDGGTDSPKGPDRPGIVPAHGKLADGQPGVVVTYGGKGGGGAEHAPAGDCWCGQPHAVEAGASGQLTQVPAVAAKPHGAVASVVPAAAMPSAVAGHPEDGDYWVSCETEEGHVLAKTPVKPRWFAQSQDVAMFTARLPYHETTRKLVLGRGRKRLGVLEVPASTPNFDLSAPLRAEDVDTAGILHLHWEPGEAAKKHPQTYFVRFTADGQKYTRPGVNLGGTSFDLDLRSMPGGKKCRAEVLATNGYHTAVGATPEFELPVKAPRLLLGSLEGPSLFAQGFSLEHGPILGEQITWLVDGKPVRSGGSFDVRTLGRGQHVVAVSIVAPDGQQVYQDLGLYDGATGRLEKEGKRL